MFCMVIPLYHSAGGVLGIGQALLFGLPSLLRGNSVRPLSGEIASATKSLWHG